MAVVANWNIATRDKNGNLKEYGVGEILDNLSVSEEKRLLKQGAVTEVLVEDDKTSKSQPKKGGK